MKFHNKTVLITGGASGIGRIMGRKTLERGARLIIWDVNDKNLIKTKTELSLLGQVAVWQVDISDILQIEKAAQDVITTFGGIDILINNAGIVAGKYFHEHTSSDISQTMKVNAEAPMHITAQFLPGMLGRKSGHICNIASAAGLMSNPKMAVYVSSKWALTGWSDSLRIEMNQLKTFYIRTGMFEGVKSRLIPILEPENVADKIMSGIEQKKIFIQMPWIVRMVRLAQGLLPVRVFDAVIGGGLGIYKTMADFTGRK